ncbi:MAG TPA: anti-sigma factor antagonist [Planctomycetota bacterium]|nr:anti-sigma factor antagonist [Planctomycetota bacterium]
MEVLTREQGALCLVKLAGEMAQNADAEKLRDNISRSVNEGKRDFLIDMGDLNYLGSPGIGALVSALEKVRRSGGNLKLAHLQGQAQKVLAVTGLDKFFDISPLEANSSATLAAAEGSTVEAVKAAKEQAVRTLIQVPSSEASMSEAGRRFAAFLEGLQLEQAQRFDLQVAFNEALANAVEHGNRSDASKCATAECAATKSAVHLRITDEGEGFDPKMAADLAADPFRDRGRGMVLMRTLMDDVTYNEKGNSVSMTKYLSHPSSDKQGSENHGQIR